MGGEAPDKEINEAAVAAKEAAEKETPGVKTLEKAAPGAKETVQKKKVRIRGVRISKKLSIVILLLEVLLLVGITVTFIKYSRADYQKPEKHAEITSGTKISCSDGLLRADRVSVKVPSAGNVAYSVAYTWAESDKKYPSIPYAAVASYHKSEEEPAYEISLYRETFIPKDKIPKGKTAGNWFSDWKEKDADGVIEKHLDSGKVHGFLISNLKGSTINSDYRSYTYTFTVKEKKGISIYVIEGVCYDSESLDEFSKIMDEAVASIAISKSA